MQKADAVITVSEYTRKQARDLYGLNVRHFITVHNGAEELETTPEHKAGDSKVVLFFGRVTSQKGPEFMLETAAKVLGRYPDVNFVVAGVGDQLGDLQDKVREWKLDDKFLFTGFLNKPQLNNVLSQTDVFLMTSVSEPFGLTALEAAQFDVPCVITNQSGVSEVLPSALKADFWDTDKLANYVYALLKYEGLHSEVADESKLAVSKLTWADAAKKVMDVYETVKEKIIS